MPQMLCHGSPTNGYGVGSTRIARWNMAYGAFTTALIALVAVAATFITLIVVAPAIIIIVSVVVISFIIIIVIVHDRSFNDGHFANVVGIVRRGNNYAIKHC